MKKFFCIFLCQISAFSMIAQTDSATQLTNIFEKITSTMATFKPDTSAVAEDKITAKIRELRSVRGGFNINEAISFKLQEDRKKGDLTEEQMKQLSFYFIQGNGKRWLDNAVNHIYRNHFTYAELKSLVKFYKSSAGQKLSANFPIIMLQSLAAAELIKTVVAK
ncbi:MAG: DUF2059 domain-containing protein [Bacteroidota bacterium]